MTTELQLSTRPNFFIVGAPKCGTTAMYEYLRTHPKVFMPLEKEPHYFMDDEPIHKKVFSEQEYLALFSAVKPEHAALGEASVWYLHSKVAAQLILSFNPSARILVFIRNPVDFVQSIHAQFSYNAGRDPDFVKAWGHEPTRSSLISRGEFGQQLQRLYDIFSQEQVLVTLLDDIRADPRREYARVLEFLGLDNDGRSEFQVTNAHKVHRAPWLSRFAKKTPRPIAGTWKITKKIMGISRIGLMDRIYRANAMTVARKPIPSELRSSIRGKFSPDIDLLGSIINRDLNHWQ